MEKDRKEGRRNEGTEKEGEEAIALSRPFERAVESIVALERFRMESLMRWIILEVCAKRTGT